MVATKRRTGRGAVARRCLAGLCVWLLASAAAAAPDIQHWTTSNGARVYFVPAPELPMVDVRVVFDAGSARDGAKPGLAAFTNHLMSQGAGPYDADQLAQTFEGVGARFGSGSLRDMSWLSVRSLSDPQWLDTAVATLATVLRQPRFAEADFQREGQRMRIALKQQEQSPASIASKTFYQAVYGEHPYATPPEGTLAGLDAIKRPDLAAFYHRYYVAANAIVAITGALDRAQAEKLAQRLVGELPKGAAAPAVPKVPDLTEGRTLRVPFPSSQTHVLIGQPGLYRGDPDYFVLYLGNHALGGGGLVSRISEEVREKRGLSYSAYSYFSPMGRKGPFVMGMQTRNEQTDEGVKVLRATLADFIKQGIRAEELEAARKNITGGFPLRIASNSKIVEYLAMIGFYGLPLDYLQTFNAHMEAVTAEQINQTFRRRLQPERMITVIVGGEAAEPAADP